MKTLRYKVSIDGIKRSHANFKKNVHKILSDKRSWPVKFVYDDDTYDFEIILTPARKIKATCHFEGLSCADPMNMVIYINNYRWTKGAKPSKLSLTNYRIYLINHEVGHLLGLGHAKPRKGYKVPVMNQHTLGIGGGKPWMWPLLSERRKIKSSMFKFF